MAEPTTQERILEAASTLLVEDGLPAFSMRKLARRVELSATAIYRHFDSKEVLISAVCHEGFRLFALYLWRALEEDSALQRLSRARLEYLRFALQHENFYRIMFMTSVALFGWETMPKDNQERTQSTFQFLVDRVRECQQAALFPRGDTEPLAVQIWAHGHGLVSLRLAGHLKVLSAAEFEALYVASCAAQLKGLAS